jgi:hypothetical protein
MVVEELDISDIERVWWILLTRLPIHATASLFLLAQGVDIQCCVPTSVNLNPINAHAYVEQQLSAGCPCLPSVTRGFGSGPASSSQDACIACLLDRVARGYKQLLHASASSSTGSHMCRS